MPNTTNFNFPTPADTDLVKDGASAIRSLGNSIDTAFVDLKGGTTGQVLSKTSNTDLDFTWVAQDDSNAIQNALLTTTGDTIYASSASTPARLGIGSTGQVLTVSAGGVPTWATASGGGSTWTLLNSGGTALTGATTITVSGISAQDKIMIFVFEASSANAGATISVRFNSDSGGNYYPFGGYNEATGSQYDQLGLYSGAAGDRFILGRIENDAAGRVSGSAFIQNATATSGVKMVNFLGTGGNFAAGGNQRNYFGWGYYNSTSAISSISVLTNTGNFDNGTVYVYTSAS